MKQAAENLQSKSMRQKSAAEPDLRRAVIRSTSDADAMYARVLNAAEHTAAWLQAFEGTPLELLTELRFRTVGHDPLTGEPLNAIEQLNQTFTILASLRAVQRLLEIHPEVNGFRLALATTSGRDIESIEPGIVAAEVFSATHPRSNQKLKKDIARLSSDSSRHRYVFFAAPTHACGRQPQLETGSGHRSALRATLMISPIRRSQPSLTW